MNRNILWYSFFDYGIFFLLVVLTIALGVYLFRQKKNRVFRIVAIIVCILGGGLAIWYIICSVISVLDFVSIQRKSIEIIGGADGPTSIFLASKIAPFNIMFIILAALLLIAGIIVICVLRKRRK